MHQCFLNIYRARIYLTIFFTALQIILIVYKKSFVGNYFFLITFFSNFVEFYFNQKMFFATVYLNKRILLPFFLVVENVMQIELTVNVKNELGLNVSPANVNEIRP